MAYRRYNRYRTRGYRKRKITYPMIGKKIWRDVKYLKSMINVEKKYADTTFSAAITPTENFQLVNGLTQGDTSSTREGQSIKCKSLFVRFYATQNASATTTQLRIIILIDTQPNGAIPVSSDLLQSNTNILSMINISYGSRFKILMDKIYRLDTNKLNIEIKKYIKLHMHTKFNLGNAGTIADITKNSLYIMMVSDQVTNSPNVDYWCRLRFIDN